VDDFIFGSTVFAMVVPGSGETPHWKVTIDATDRKLIGTDRFERSVRSQQYTLEGELWIDPTNDVARQSWEQLQADYAVATEAFLTTPGGGAQRLCIILTFEVVPLRGGVDGYRGKVVFGLPGGMSV